MPITLSKEQLMRYASKNDQSCVLLIEVSYVEHQHDNNNGGRGMRLTLLFTQYSIYPIENEC